MPSGARGAVPGVRRAEQWRHGHVPPVVPGRRRRERRRRPTTSTTATRRRRRPPTATDLAASSAGERADRRQHLPRSRSRRSGGVVSRVQLPMGTNAEPAAVHPEQHLLGMAPGLFVPGRQHHRQERAVQRRRGAASGLVLNTLVDGPVMKVLQFTSQKSGATYSMTYRFFANAPYYQYDLARTGTNANVVSSFWYLNGSFALLGMGTGGRPRRCTTPTTTGRTTCASPACRGRGVASIDGRQRRHPAGRHGLPDPSAYRSVAVRGDRHRRRRRRMDVLARRRRAA